MTTEQRASLPHGWKSGSKDRSPSYFRGGRISVVFLMFALGACNFGDDVGGKVAGNKAQGDVQPGTISDAMIPLDQIRSQSPFERIENLPESEGGLPPPEPSAEGDGAVDGASDTTSDRDGNGASNSGGAPAPAGDSGSEASASESISPDRKTSTTNNTDN